MREPEIRKLPRDLPEEKVEKIINEIETREGKVCGKLKGEDALVCIKKSPR